MRTIVLAMVAAMAATTASAMDLGNGFALNTDVEAQHKVDAETSTLKVIPELEYVTGELTLTANTTLDVWDNANDFTLRDEFRVAPTVEFGASYMLREDLELEAVSGYNFDTNAREEITLTATFSF